MKKRLWKWLGALLTVFACGQAAAEDIDLFMGPTLSSSAALPNVLIILDNTANWNTAFTNEMAALNSLFAALPSNKFRVGLMMFTETGGGNSTVDGGYVRAAVRTMDAANKAKYAAMFTSFGVLADKSNGGKASLVLMEAYRYLKGQTAYGGTSKLKTDYTNNTNGYATDDAVHALAGNALSAFNATTYASPIDTASCAKTYIIYLSNGNPAENTSDLNVARDYLSAEGGSIAEISLNPAGSQTSWVDEWARWIKKSSLAGTIYTVDIDKKTTGQGPGWTAALKSMANQSSGKYFDVSSSGSGVLDTLNTIFSEIQSVNSVFASVSLPISVNTQGTYLNQVFVGMFRPDADSYPRWAGNLKQYKIGFSSNTLKLQDADSNSAINNLTGFITECARSFWTPTTADTEFTSSPKGDCLTVANSDVSNYPDGNVVDKGANAYRLRQSSSRTMKTCNDTDCTSMVTFNSTNVTTSKTGIADSTTNASVVNWEIGQDILDEDIDAVTSAERRLSIHGDVVHSRPVAVNFGTDAAPKVVVFYGANDGLLHAINGNRTDAIGSVAAGEELWSFMPGEFWSKMKRLYDNSPAISYPGASSGSAKGYAMDGAMTAYQGTVGGSSKVILYATMRRGGRSIYAFDVTNAATSPNSPTFKWRIGCSSAGECSDDMEGIGQTWSSVRAFKHASYSSGNTPLLVFGGGYDTCEDYDAGSAGGANHNCTGSSKGHYVYVVDGDTGEVQKAFDTGGTRGIIADVLVVPDADGYGKYGYTADLGGNVYRITMTGAPSAWTMTKIASLGCATTTACTAPRKFMFEPSVVDNGDDTYTLYLGSGDREKPVTAYSSSNAVTNYFFMFTDKPAQAPGTYPGSTYCGSNIICLDSLFGIAQNVNGLTAAEQATKPQGWYKMLLAKEQVVTTAIVIFGTVTFSTHAPMESSSSSCTPNLGTTKVYNVDYLTGGSTNGTNTAYQDVAGDGLPPSPVGGLVTLDTGQTVPFCIGCSPDSPLEAVQKSGGGVSSRPKSRLYWYIEK
ncbi:MAG: pilus assembly protein PilY [Burkholderiales bacterium]|nr:pilus assembly protein PilY [Burkholderiales bacterium]